MQQAIHLETTMLQSFLKSNPFDAASNLLTSSNLVGLAQLALQLEMAMVQSLTPINPLTLAKVSVTINGAPASSPEGTTINLTSTVTERGQILPHKASYTYAWNVTKDGKPYASGNQANFSFTPNDNGTYVVRLTATDRLGRKGTSSNSIAVTNVPPSVAITGVPSQATVGTPISVGSSVHDPSSVDQQAGFTYSWTVTQQGGNGTVVASGNQANFSFTPASAGTYVISLSATDKDGGTGSTQQTVAVTNSTSTPSNLILLPPDVLSSLRQQAAANTPQWQAFKSRLDQNLPQVLSDGAYEGSQLTWIGDYALGYQVLKDSDPATASNYADKAIAVMKSGLNDYQVGYMMTRQFLTQGDGGTTTFTLPNSDLIPSSLVVYEAPVTTTAVVRGTSNSDVVADFQHFLKVSNTPGGNADYVEGRDWLHDPNLPNNTIEWLPSGHQPAAGSTYYVTETSALNGVATPVPYTLNGNTVTLATVPTTGQAVFVEYVYGTHSSDGSTLAYQQTSAGDGGFNNIFIDDGYSSRYLGKYEALGLNWLDGYSGLSPALESQTIHTLQQWFNNVPTVTYRYYDPASNYADGSYVSQVFTALALQGKTSDASQMLANEVAYRQNNVLPVLQGPTTSLYGGFWSEGWSYGQAATENLLEAGLALEEAGQITATPERQWASQVVEQLVEAQPSASTVYDGGDWYAYPAPFPSKEFFAIVGNMTSDPTERSYANYILQNYSSAYSNDAWDLLFRDPSAPASFWSNLPLQYLAQGTGLLTARSDWGSTPTWVSEQMGNLLAADHQSYTPGQLQIQRGGDDLLVNATAVGGNQTGAQESTDGNTIIVNDNGDGLQRYPYSMGYWYGSPGVTVTAYEASGNHVYMAGNYAAAYSPANAPGSGGPVSELTREVVYLQPNYVVVYDRVTTLKDTYAKQQRWHFLNAPTVTGNSFAETVGSSRLFGQTFSRVPLTTTVAPVQVGSATVQELITQNASPTASVRYVTAFQTAPFTTATMDATTHVLTTDSRMEGTQIGNQLVLFGYAAGTVDLTTPVTYALTGTNSVSNLLVDLQAGGVYQIQSDGVLLGNVAASGQGTLSFTTPAGAQQVTVTRIR